MTIAIALVLALASTTLTNLAYVREQQAAAALPELSIRRPLRSLRLLLADRRWMGGFAMEAGGFTLFVVAVALAPLALVQSVAAGGIGLLAFASTRIAHRRLEKLEVWGVVMSVVGLLALSISLVNGGGEGGRGSTGPILAWLGITVALAAATLVFGRARIGTALANGIAGGLLFSIGDISTKLATELGARSAFAVTAIIGYGLGTALLQVGYQAGAALTVAGIATLLTNALPIAAAAVVLGEPVPSGALGALRIFAFAAVTAGAVLLALPARRQGAA